MENPEQVNFLTGLAHNKMQELEEEKGKPITAPIKKKKPTYAVPSEEFP